MAGLFKAQQGGRRCWRREIEREGRGAVVDRRSDRWVGARLHGISWALVRTRALVEARSSQRVLSRGVMWSTCVVCGSPWLPVE